MKTDAGILRDREAREHTRKGSRRLYVAAGEERRAQSHPRVQAGCAPACISSAGVNATELLWVLFNYREKVIFSLS